MQMIRFALSIGAALMVLGLSASVNAGQDSPAAQTTPSNLSGLHDFDFLVGEWRVHNRRLKERLAGSNEWEEFEGTIVSRPYMGGWANVDDTEFRTPQGLYRGVAPRAYDP